MALEFVKAKDFSTINIAVTLRQASACNKPTLSVHCEASQKDTLESTIALHRIRNGLFSANSHNDVYVFLGGITSLCEPNCRSWYWPSPNVCVRRSSSIFSDIYCRFLSSIFGVYFLIWRPGTTTVTWGALPTLGALFQVKINAKIAS